jgi:hypothetical protein
MQNRWGLAMTASDKKIDPKETERRRDGGLRRALSTPPQPRKGSPK